MNRKEKALNLLKERPQGVTAFEARDLGFGVDFRKTISTLIDDGNEIKKVWESRSGKRYLRYFLESEYKEPEKPHYYFTNNKAIECSCINKESHESMYV